VGYDAQAPPRPLTLTSPFRLDLRSLALFRIGLGLLILADLAIRSTDLVAHYTDAGLLPRAQVVDMAARPAWFSVYFAVGDTAGTGALFGLHATLALLLVLGIRTRVVTAACWIMMVSLQGRNPLVLSAGDTLLRLCLFWGMFLPLGNRFSFDTRRVPRASPSDVLSAGTIAYVFQLCFMYWFSAALKTGAPWSDGTALYYALHVDFFAKPGALWLRELTWILPTLTYAALYWERIGPALLFVPVWNDRFRLLTIAGFGVFHLSIFKMFAIGVFPMLCIVAWLPIVPGAVWAWLAHRAARHDSATGSPPSPPAGPASATLAVDRPRSMRAITARCTTTALAASALLYVLAWNLRTLDSERVAPYFPVRWNLIADLVRLDQHWSMFSPAPPTRDGWYVLTGTLESGEDIDLDTGRPPAWSKPPLVVATVPNRRWGKYLMRLRDPEYVSLRSRYARYRARRWNTTHHEADHITTIALFSIEERTPPPGQEASAHDTTRLWYERLGVPD
jgi:hypothetical protein